MLYRFAAALIVVFWLTMTTLLVRDGGALRAVPVEHVVKLIFHHQQPSDLNIVSERMRLGRLRILPQSDRAAGRRTLAFEGHLQWSAPGVKRQRIAWEGELEMDAALGVQRFRLAATTHGPAEMRSEIVLLPKENVVRYAADFEGHTEAREFTLDERGAREIFQHLGLDPTLLPVTAGAHAPVPIVKAAQSTLAIHGERIETYLVTIESNGQTWLECHVSQLGQVLSARTLLGYTLAPDDILP